jgi:hypothetical protein
LIGALTCTLTKLTAVTELPLAELSLIAAIGELALVAALLQLTLHARLIEAA